VTLDSTFLNKTASSKREPVDLTDDELLVTKPNSKVSVLPVNDPNNVKGRLFQIYTHTDENQQLKLIPVTLYRNAWYQLRRGSTNETFTLDGKVRIVHNYDIPTAAQQLDEGLTESAGQASKAKDSGDEQTKDVPTDDDAEQPDLLNQAIRNSPLQVTKPLSRTPTIKPTTTTQHPIPSKPTMATQTQTKVSSTATTTSLQKPR
jgi:hypothetical protein